MTPHETYVAQQLADEGWTVVRDGLPDWFCYRTDADGKTEIQFVEAKADYTKVQPNQAQVISALRAAGVTVRIIRDTGFYRWHYAEGRKPLYAPRKSVFQLIHCYVKMLLPKRTEE
jgi:hypothetical protein